MTAGRTPEQPDRFIVIAMAAFLAVHLALTFLMPNVHAKFMLGDRAHDRLAKVERVLGAYDAQNAVAIIVEQGSPGDYILFVPAYGLFGPEGVMLQSIVLYLIAMACLYALVRDAFGRQTAALATILYAILPATFFHPQAFVSEAISNPLLIIATYAFARSLISQDRYWKWTVLSGVLIGVVVFSRHVYLLLPMLAAVLTWHYTEPPAHRFTKSAVILGLGYAAALVWSLIATLAPVESHHSASAGGLGANLQARAERIALVAGAQAPEPLIEPQREGLEHATQTITPSQFSAFILDHPLAYVRTIASDAVNILANPGMAMVAGRYFGVFDLNENSEDDLSRWRKIRDQHGMFAVAAELRRTSAMALIVNAVGIILWATVLALAILGAVVARRSTSVAQPIVTLLVGLVLYVITFNSIVAGYTRWDHRSGIEFALVIFAAYAVVSGKVSELLKPLLARIRIAGS